MKYFIDLDDTLVNSTILNNDAYNFALEQYGFDRIVTKERLTRDLLVGFKNLDKIIKLKQKLNLILSKNTGKTIKQITLDTERDHYLDSKEALEYGIIDSIIE